MNKVQKFLRDSEYQEAADYASKMMDDDEFKGSEDVLADLKLHAMVRGNLDGATESFEKYLKENSDNQRKTNRMLVTVLQANRKTAVAPEMFAVAKKSAAAIAEAEPKSAGSLYTYARFLYQEKDFDKAIEVQEKAVANGGPRKSVLERFLKVLKTEKEESEEGK